MWTDAYIDIPFRLGGTDRDNGLDCYRLVRLVYSEQLQIDLPEYGDVMSRGDFGSLRHVIRTIRRERERWTRVDTPLPYDVILLKSGGLADHIGVVVDRKYMLHIKAGTHAVIENYRDWKYKDRIDGYYRYE